MSLLVKWILLWHVSGGTHSLLHLPPIYSTYLFIVMFFFTVRVAFNISPHISVTLRHKISSDICCWYSLTFIPQKHLERFLSRWIFSSPSSTRSSCETRHIFIVAILRYNLAKTQTIYKPSLQGCEPLYHTCHTKLISARSFLFCVCLSPTQEIQQEE